MFCSLYKEAVVAEVETPNVPGTNVRVEDPLAELTPEQRMALSQQLLASIEIEAEPDQGDIDAAIRMKAYIAKHFDSAIRNGQGYQLARRISDFRQLWEVMRTSVDEVANGKPLQKNRLKKVAGLNPWDTGW